MDVINTTSTSKGVFVFKNGFNKSRSTKIKTLNPQCDKIWFNVYKDNWNYFEQQIKDLNHRTYETILFDIVDYIRICYDCRETVSFENLIPSCALVTGVNQHDSSPQFHALASNLRKNVTPHVAMVYAQNALKVKQLVESVVWQLIYGEDLMIDDDLDSSPAKTAQTKSKQKSMCSMSLLKKWHLETYGDINLNTDKPSRRGIKPLVIILPEFENYICDVLQDFVMIISSYISILPIVLVFGVATSLSAVHKSFPYQVSSKLMIKVFHSHTSQEYLNQIIEKIFLTHQSPFHLSAKVFKMLRDIFLLHDFSVKGFIQNVKYCMKYHTFGDNVKALCCERKKLSGVIENLNASDIESLRKLPSFRPFLESQDSGSIIALFEDDEFFMKNLLKCIDDFHDYSLVFYTSLRILLAIIRDLPRNNFGKSLQELYIKCSSGSVTKTQEFDECMQLLSFQSQSKLEKTIRSALQILSTEINMVTQKKTLSSKTTTNCHISNGNCNLKDLKGQYLLSAIEMDFTNVLNDIKNANIEAPLNTDINTSFNQSETIENICVRNRYQLKEKLFQSTKMLKGQSEFETLRTQFVAYLKEMFSITLLPFHTRTFHELFVFDDMANVEKQIIGPQQEAIHAALSNPVEYLQCSCCKLARVESVIPTLPDAGIAYKLHLECGKQINLHDWLQAFAAVLGPTTGDGEREERGEVPPSVQARFYRAVSELHYHGYIKPSKRKSDHVTRLTW